MVALLDIRVLPRFSYDLDVVHSEFGNGRFHPRTHRRRWLDGDHAGAPASERYGKPSPTGADIDDCVVLIEIGIDNRYSRIQILLSPVRGCETPGKAGPWILVRRWVPKTTIRWRMLTQNELIPFTGTLNGGRRYVHIVLSYICVDPIGRPKILTRALRRPMTDCQRNPK